MISEAVGVYPRLAQKEAITERASSRPVDAQYRDHPSHLKGLHCFATLFEDRERSWQLRSPKCDKCANLQLS